MSIYEGPLKQLIRVFAGHRVAANLLMALMILSGIYGLTKLNTQFFPSFSLDTVTVQVIWSGASAEDIATSVLVPIEDELRSVDNIRQIFATARLGSASIRIELDDGSDVDYALSEVKQRLDSVRSRLPADIEEPLVQKTLRYEEIADVILTSSQASLDELRRLTRQFEQELLDLGVRKIDFTGLAEEEIAILVQPDELHKLGMTLSELAADIRLSSIDLPAGTAARDEGARQLRSLSQQRDVEGFRQLPLNNTPPGQLIRIDDIAQVERRIRDGQVLLSYKGQPAIRFSLKRTESEDSLRAARILTNWLESARNDLPGGIELVVFNERWQLISDRIGLLIKNGLTGLLLLVMILFLFLNARVAFWVMVGIPVSFLATLGILYGIGGSINMMSLFALIMALGIIVDDAIVVGEDTLTHLQQGEPGLQAAIGGAHRMQSPVIASSLTTIAAFLPLLMVGGIIGNILIDIPLVVICVIIASLIECFLILPGHLHHSLHRAADLKPSALRIRLDKAFDQFRNHAFRQRVRFAVRYPWVVLASTVGLLILSAGLLAGGQLKFNFFPSVEQDILTANVQFAAGTDTTRINAFLQHLDTTLRQTDSNLDEKLLKLSLQQQGIAYFPRTGRGSFIGDEYASLHVELTTADDRTVSNQAFIQQWRQSIQLPAGIEKFSINISQGGPPGKPIEIKLTGTNTDRLKQASLAVQDALRAYPGLSNIDDDLPFGTSQLIYSLNTQGHAAGLQLETLGRQLRAAFDGLRIQSFYEGQDEIEVRVSLPDASRNQLVAIEQLPIVLPDGSTSLLGNLVELTARQGLDSVQRINGQLALNVSADLDEQRANANDILADLKTRTLPDLLMHYGVEASFEGKSRDQQETLADMRTGLMLGLALIYIILAWVFASYSWPVIVMLTIPLGLTGAILGHFLTGQSLTVLSLFGLFGLSGIVINDTIVLVSFYKKLREQGVAIYQAIEEAACQRLRAVLLTTLTTIAGLAPILFETSVQAQFLIPMATSIVFGLAYGSVLILLVVPAMLSILEGKGDPANQNQADTTQRHSSQERQA